MKLKCHFDFILSRQQNSTQISYITIQTKRLCVYFRLVKINETCIFSTDHITISEIQITFEMLRITEVGFNRAVILTSFQYLPMN